MCISVTFLYWYKTQENHVNAVSKEHRWGWTYWYIWRSFSQRLNRWITWPAFKDIKSLSLIWRYCESFSCQFMHKTASSSSVGYLLPSHAIFQDPWRVAHRSQSSLWLKLLSSDTLQDVMNYIVRRIRSIYTSRDVCSKFMNLLMKKILCSFRPQPFMLVSYT